METPKRKRTRKKKVGYTVAEVLQAKELAFTYLRNYRSHNLRKKPWRTDVPLESLPVFRQFVEVGKLIENLEADPKHFIKAQFQEWNGPSGTLPRPMHLSTQGAVDRYNQWFMKVLPPAKPKKKRTREDVFKSDQKKADALMCGGNFTIQEALCSDPGLFSMEFLKRHGVWKVVKDYWMENCV